MYFAMRMHSLRSVVIVTAVGAWVSLVGCSRRGPEPSSEGAKAATERGSNAPALTAMPTSDDPMAMPAASVAAVVNPEGLMPYSGPTGSVEGTVYVKGPAAPDVPDVSAPLCPAAMDTYGKLFRAGPARADGLRPLADALVVLTGYTGSFVPEKDTAAKAVIGPGCAYPTRTIAMTFGQWLEVSNDSKQPFGPFLEGVFQGAVRVAPPDRAGEPVKVYPPRAGHFILHDRLQPFVREDVWVLRHPLHAVTDPSGHFRIDGAPVGALKLGVELSAIESHEVIDMDVHANVVQNTEVVLTYAPKSPAAAASARPGRHLPPND
jgi:hypothetical protein